MLEFKYQQIDDGTGIDKNGYLLECSCGGDIFFIFQLPINHLHYQCAQCEQSYCTTDMCDLTKQETREAAQGLYPR